MHTVVKLHEKANKKDPINWMGDLQPRITAKMAHTEYQIMVSDDETRPASIIPEFCSTLTKKLFM